MRNNFWAQVVIQRFWGCTVHQVQGTNKMAAPNSSRARKNPPRAAPAPAPEPQRLGLPKYIPQKRRILTKPQEIQVWVFAIHGAPEPDHPTEEWSRPTWTPQLVEEGTQEKMLQMELCSIQLPQKTQGVSFPIPFRDPPLGLSNNVQTTGTSCLWPS